MIRLVVDNTRASTDDLTDFEPEPAGFPRPLPPETPVRSSSDDVRALIAEARAYLTRRGYVPPPPGTPPVPLRPLTGKESPAVARARAALVRAGYPVQK